MENSYFKFYLIYALSLPFLSASSTANELSLRLELTHVDDDFNLTAGELIRRGAARSKARLAHLARRPCPAGSHGKTQAPVFWGPQGDFVGEYLFELGVGTPHRFLPFILDTGSTLVWTQCQPCVSCEPQPVPFFNPKKSSTFSKLPCSGNVCAALGMNYGLNCSGNPDCHFNYSYLDGSRTIGYIGWETITFRYSSEPPVSVPHFAIGCARINKGTMASSTGTAGFGRSPDSIVSQLRVTMFSYCFIPFLPRNTKRSPLLLGSAAGKRKNLAGGYHSTPLLKDQLIYYVSLEGITVGSTRLLIPPSVFTRKADGTGGTIFDSGTFSTILVTEAYAAVMKAFVSAIKLPVSNETIAGDYQLCFKTPRRGFSPESVKIPKLIYHFKGAELDLPTKNYVVYDEKEGMLCLLVLDGEGDGTNIIGNFYQQNFHVVYDLKNKLISFAPAKCHHL